MQERGEKTSKKRQSTLRKNKTDVAYWQTRIFKPTFTRNGEKGESSLYSVKIQYRGRRETFPLHSTNKATSARKARDIYQLLVGAGWEEALAKYKPELTPRAVKDLTVGQYLNEALSLSTARPRTISCYASSFRQIVAGVSGILHTSKIFYAEGEERSTFYKQVGAVRLANLTPSKIHKWMLAEVKKANGDPLREQQIKRTLNSRLRDARALFSPKKIVRRLPQEIRDALPEPLPLEDVEFFSVSKPSYVSNFNIEKVVEQAFEELPFTNLNAFKILLLCGCCGLRRKEVDCLLTCQIDLKTGYVSVEETKYFRPKSSSSCGKVPIDPNILPVMAQLLDQTEGEFFLESNRLPKPNATYTYYRCETDHAFLIAWLRSKGVDDQKPIHCLRKEAGNRLAKVFGLFAAKNFLRHSAISTTESFYATREAEKTPGFGKSIAGKLIKFEDAKAG